MSRSRFFEETYEKGYNVKSEVFYEVNLVGVPMLFTCARLRVDTIPQGLYLYEVEYSENECGKPCRISKKVKTNYWGALLSKTPILPADASSRPTCESEWSYTGEELSIAEYLDPSKRNMRNPRYAEQPLSA